MHIRRRLERLEQSVRQCAAAMSLNSDARAMPHRFSPSAFTALVERTMRSPVEIPQERRDAFRAAATAWFHEREAVRDRQELIDAEEHATSE
jgi:hypothetical protein